jgi:hypothetical protein
VPRAPALAPAALCLATVPSPYVPSWPRRLSAAPSPLLSPSPQGTTVIVSYTTRGLTATAGSDFTPASGVLTFTQANWMLPQNFTVEVLGDSAVEGTERFAVDFAALGAFTGTLLPNTTTVSILDYVVRGPLDVCEGAAFGPLGPGAGPGRPWTLIFWLWRPAAGRRGLPVPKRACGARSRPRPARRRPAWAARSSPPCSPPYSLPPPLAPPQNNPSPQQSNSFVGGGVLTPVDGTTADAELTVWEVPKGSVLRWTWQTTDASGAAIGPDAAIVKKWKRRVPRGGREPGTGNYLGSGYEEKRLGCALFDGYTSAPIDPSLVVPSSQPPSKELEWKPTARAYEFRTSPSGACARVRCRGGGSVAFLSGRWLGEGPGRAVCSAAAARSHPMQSLQSCTLDARTRVLAHP